jgi:hypothetical protein
VVAARSLTCPSPTSTTRQVPLVVVTRSTVTKGLPSAETAVSGWAVASRHVPPVHHVRISAPVKSS